uniref:Rho GTPase-activating protein 21 n=1 Tax=Schistocephalus solidus TaxID=70667 RepID=A0A0X3Q2S5_SCHSO
MQDISVLHIPRGLYGFEFSIKDNGDCQGTVQVSQVRAGGSAEQAGLQRGSRIVAVNGQSVDSLTFLQVSNLIRRSSGLSIELSVLTTSLAASSKAKEDKLPDDVRQSKAGELITPSNASSTSSMLFNDSGASRPLVPSSRENDAAYNVAPDVEEGADRHEHQDCLQGDALPYGELSTELSYSLGRQQQHRQESSDTLEHSPTRIPSPSEAAKGCEIKEHQNGTVDTNVSSAIAGAQTTSTCVRHRVSTSRSRADPRRQALLLSKPVLADELSPASARPPSPPAPVPCAVVCTLEDAVVVTAQTPPLYADFVDSINEALSNVVEGVQLTRKRAYTSGQRCQLRSGESAACSHLAHNTSAPAGCVSPNHNPQPRFLPAYPPRRLTGPPLPSMEVTPPPNFLPKRSLSTVVPPAATEECRRALTRNASDELLTTAIQLVPHTLSSSPPPPPPPETRSCGGDAPEVGLDLPDGHLRRHHHPDNQGGTSFTTLAAYMEQFAAVDRHKLQIRLRQSTRPTPQPAPQRRLSEHNQLFVPRPRPQKPSTGASQHSTSPVSPDGPQALSNGENDSSTFSNTAAGRRGLRSWLKNLKSEDDHVCLLPQAFFSRACLCKIITLDGQPGKSYNWKEYFMCITDEEVRFVRTSTAVSQTSSNKSAKTSSRWELEGYDPTAGETAVPAARAPEPAALSEPPLTCCLILPLAGLFWSRQTQLPPDLPPWNPIPLSAGGSHQCRLDSTAPANNPCSAACCYLFHHAETGLQLLVIFPDECAAAVSLDLCSKYRSGELKENSNPAGGALSVALTTRTCARTPSPTGPSEHSAPKLSHSLSLNSVPSATAASFASMAPAGARAAARPVTTDLPPPAAVLTGSVATVLSAVRNEEDERARTRSPLRRTRKSLPDPAARRKLDGQTQHQHQPAQPTSGGKRLRDKSRERKYTPDGTGPPPPPPPPPPPSNDPYTVTDNSSRLRNFTAPFVRSIARLISRQNRQNVVSAAAAGDNSSLGEPSLRSSEHLAMRIADVMGEPPDFSSLNEPGPVFGAPLESQIQSPDHPGVPLMLDALVQAVQTHGLYHVGLYRAPGRQKEINRFVCLANLTSFDPDVLLCLEAWKDVRVLSGLVKLFIRRLPHPFFDMASWEPLACLVPDQGTEWTTPAIAFALMSIRVQLEKNLKQTPSAGFPEATCNWRFMTLDFLFSHLRRVVAYEPANQVSYECISICFGPVLFATSTHMTQMNKILELILRHWPWLVATLDPLSRKQASRHLSLTETEAYVEEFQQHQLHSSTNPELSGNFDEGDASRLISPIVATAAAADPAVPAESAIREMRALFNRAGLLDESILFVDEAVDQEAVTNAFFAQSSLPIENDSLVQAVLQALPQSFGPYSDPTLSPVAKPDKQRQQSAIVEQDENGDGGVDPSCCSVTAAGGSSSQRTHF